MDVAISIAGDSFSWPVGSPSSPLTTPDCVVLAVMLFAARPAEFSIRTWRLAYQTAIWRVVETWSRVALENGSSPQK
jgi:hypothetical protein